MFLCLLHELTLENTEGAITKGQSRKIGNTGYTRRRKTKQKHNTICITREYRRCVTVLNSTIHFDRLTKINQSINQAKKKRMLERPSKEMV